MGPHCRLSGREWEAGIPETGREGGSPTHPCFTEHISFFLPDNMSIFWEFYLIIGLGVSPLHVNALPHFGVSGVLTNINFKFQNVVSNQMLFQINWCSDKYQFQITLSINI